MNRRAVLRGGAVSLLLIFGFVAGLYVDQAYPDYVPYFAHRSVANVDLIEVQQAVRLIQADYVDTNLDPNKLSHATVQGLVSGLGDPYSAYFDPAAYKRLQESYQGQYTGIGIYLSFSSSYPLITGTVPGSPAAAAGLLGGDEIVKVGDKDAKGITVDQATSLIQGPEGTSVTLTILRGQQTLTFTVKRAQIEVPSVRSTTMAGSILYVRIYQFGSQTAAEFATALNKGLPGSTGMVLDLRGNPGGFVSAADDVISEFVTSGETFETHGRTGIDKHQVGSRHEAPTIPLVVLINANSASSSEIVAGSLQVHQRAKLVGTKSYGKGSVQEDFVLSDGADIHLTVQRWFLPNGQTIDHKGLTPDVTITLPDASDMFDVTQTAQGFANDTQLNAGLRLLAGS